MITREEAANALDYFQAEYYGGPDEQMQMNWFAKEHNISDNAALTFDWEQCKFDAMKVNKTDMTIQELISIADSEYCNCNNPLTNEDEQRTGVCGECR